MMNIHKNKAVGQCSQRTCGKARIVIAMVALAWLSLWAEESQAQRRVYRPHIGLVAEKPFPSPANAPLITSAPVVDDRYVDIHFQNFAANVSKITLERKIVTKYGNAKWLVVWTMNIHDHRDSFDPTVRDNQRRPGAKYVYHETGGLVPGDKYQYRVRAIQPYKPSPVVLLSAVKTVTVPSLEQPTEPTETEPTETEPTETDPAETDPTSPDPTLPTVDTQTINLKAKQIGPVLRLYVAIPRIRGEITEIEIPEVDGEPLQVYFAKPGYKLTQYVSNPDATIMLTSGQTSTPSQIDELFGSTQKGRLVKLVAFVRASQGNRPKSIAIKVSSIKSN